MKARLMNIATYHIIPKYYSTKFIHNPLHKNKVAIDNAAACNGRVITVEDHYPEVSHICDIRKQ